MILSWKESTLAFLCLLPTQAPCPPPFPVLSTPGAHHLGALSSGFLVGLSQWERLAEDWWARVEERKAGTFLPHSLCTLVPGL